jgi:hypothetical protein
MTYSRSSTRELVDPKIPDAMRPYQKHADRVYRPWLAGQKKERSPECTQQSAA